MKNKSIHTQETTDCCVICGNLISSLRQLQAPNADICLKCKKDVDKMVKEDAESPDR